MVMVQKEILNFSGNKFTVIKKYHTDMHSRKNKLFA